MQWDESTRGGFTTAAKPWLPLDRDNVRQNVATLTQISASILNLYRALIMLRRAHRALSDGTFQMVAVTNAAIVFERTFGADRFVVALNLGGQAEPLPPSLMRAEIVLSTMMDRKGPLESATLRANEGLLLRPSD
jgi:glycosidase